MVGRQCSIIAHNIQEESMKDMDKCKINVTVGNVQKMKWELKGSVNMKLKGGETVKMTKDLYVTQ